MSGSRNTAAGVPMAKAGAKPAGTARKPATRSKPRGKPVRKTARGSGMVNPLREVFSVMLGCLGIVFGLGVIGLCFAGWYACGLATNVLKEIGERDFSACRDRIATYQAYLDSLNGENYTVTQGKTNIILGKESFTWVVQPRGSNELRRFQWVHDYELNQVYPRTNPALCLDVELGYVDAAQAGGIELAANEHYDPGDIITMAMVQNNFSMIQAQHMADGEGWDPALLAESTVGAPRLSPAEAAAREVNAYKELLAEEAEEEIDPEADPEAPPELGNATDVIGVQGGGSSDDPGGEDPVEID